MRGRIRSVACAEAVNHAEPRETGARVDVFALALSERFVEPREARARVDAVLALSEHLLPSVARQQGESKWTGAELNRRPLHFQCNALPAELPVREAGISQGSTL